MELPRMIREVKPGEWIFIGRVNASSYEEAKEKAFKRNKSHGLSFGWIALNESELRDYYLENRNHRFREAWDSLTTLVLYRTYRMVARFGWGRMIFNKLCGFPTDRVISIDVGDSWF